MKDINDLDWGNFTPELYNDEKKTVVHVFNHSLIGEENIDRSIRFAIGRIEWLKSFTSQECRHEIVFDDRGQDIDDNTRYKIIKSLEKHASIVSFISKRR